MGKLIRRLKYFLHRDRMEAELAEEMAFHRSLSGARAMGNVTLSREDARAVWIWPWLESVFQDVVYAIRGFARQPGFTAIAVLALAFAIGLNTSLFTVFNAAALQPWPVKDPGRVVKIFGKAKPQDRSDFDDVRGFSASEFRYLAEHTHSMAGLFMSRAEGGVVTENGKIRADYVSGGYFQVLGVDMERGRGFLPDEDRLDVPEAVAVLSYNAWRNHYGSDPAIVGRQIRLRDTPFTVVGVLRPEFRGTDPEVVDIWLPFSSIALIGADGGGAQLLHDPESCCVDIGGRLNPGISRRQAQAELSVLSIDFHRRLHDKSDGVTLSATPLLQRPGHKAQQIYAVFALMFAGMILVLLLACANVGNLLLARATARRREIGVRLSIGAGRGRLVRQLLTESLALALVASGLGLWMAWALPRPIFQRAVSAVSFDLTPDRTVLAFTVTLAVLACLAFGLAPALHATRGALHDALKHRSEGQSRLALRGFLLAVQVAVSVVLLVSAGLLVRGVQHMRGVDPGFRVNGVSSVALDFPSSAYRGERLQGFYRELAAGLKELSAVSRYGLAQTEPLGTSQHFTGFRLPGDKQNRTILTVAASGGYFDILQIPIVAGRNFAPADADRHVVLINEAMAARFFPGQNPLGKSILIGKPFEIVGVVRNAHTWSLDRVEPAIYTPVSFDDAPRMLIANTPAGIAAVSALVSRLDSRVQVTVHPLSDNFDRWLGASSIGAAIAGALGLFALALATVGVAGVFSYAVQQRTQEIGIRMAMGARPRQVVSLVLASSARSLIVGLAIGLLCAFAVSGLIRKQLFGVSRLDFATYAGVLLSLALAALFASWIPARRAVKLDPVKALQQD